MSDDLTFPTLKTFKKLEDLLYPEKSNLPGALKGFSKAIDTAFDAIGFSETYVQEQSKTFADAKLDDTAIEKKASSVSKVVKDLVWGMVELDESTVSLLDSPITQRLRYIKQNGFTYLVYPPASHVRFEHSLGVFSVASQYIASINASASKPNRLSEGLSAKEISPKLALDIKHAAMLHDIGHLPFSHVLETIYESAPEDFTLGPITVRDFEICFMQNLRNSKSHLSERLSIALVLSPRFKKYYSALRQDKWAYLRIACLISGMPLHHNKPGYSQLISGAVDCDKIDYLLRDSLMCNVPVAIDKARLFLNSTLVECAHPGTIEKLIDRGVITLANADLESPCLILVLNTSGVDTIEEVAFARATMYERVYRHSVTRNAERILSVAIWNTALKDSIWRDALKAFTFTDDTLLASLSQTKFSSPRHLTERLRRRSIPKRAFAFSPDFYTPVVPYISIFSGISDGEVDSQYYHEVISKDPFHSIVESLKERSAIFISNEKHRDIEQRIAQKAKEIRKQLQNAGQSDLPSEDEPTLFFIPLPDHSATPTSCAIVTREGELESSGDYSRAPQLVSAKEIGRSVGFVTCEPAWSEIVFLASQQVLYNYFESEVIQIDLPLEFQKPQISDLRQHANLPLQEVKVIKVGAIKRFYIPEHLASKRCRLNRTRLDSYRLILSESGYYDGQPRLATAVPYTSELKKIGSKFKDYSGQHGWAVTEETIRHFINQFPTDLRDEAKQLIAALNFLDRKQTGKLLKNAVSATLDKIEEAKHVYIVPLAGTSAHVSLELLKQEFRAELRKPSISLMHSIHEVLGVAKDGDAAVFIDDNIATGTQFSAQLLRWTGAPMHKESIRREKGVELTALDLNRREALKGLDIWLATCVGATQSETSVRNNLKGSGINFSGLNYGSALSSSTANKEWEPSKRFLEFLRTVGAECIRHCRGLEIVTKACRDNAVGYSNLQGLTVTLWNVPTSTYTALWAPGIVRDEPWCPLFIRRGYVQNLVIA